MNKKELRREIMAKKRNMTPEEIEQKSAILAKKLYQTEAYRSAKTVYGYMPYNQEVRTVPILEQAMLDGKRVAVPKVYGEEMRFLYVQDLTAMEKSSYGIPEPVDDEPVADDPAALVLMPGLAFDPEGHRVGYGGGFYDKFLQQETEHPTVALCYDFQILPKLDTEEHDIPVDSVLWA